MMSDGLGEPTGPKRLAKSKLLLQVRKRKVIQNAWEAIRRNARTSKSEDTKKEILKFEENLSQNLRRISDQLQQKKFKFLPARGVRIPKDNKDRSNFRPLVVAPVESRIVQRAVHDVLVSVPAIQKFVNTAYSFGGIRKMDNEMAAVPAAIGAVLNAIARGNKYIIRSDINKFFTRIPKSALVSVVGDAVKDDEFLELFSQAIKVELENMAQLREYARAFPIEDIGVAQGNSLSPLLGNIFLYDFDREINELINIRCIRYIDDFIILAPTKEDAETAFDKAQYMLATLGLQLSVNKTEKAYVEKGFEFLGVDLLNGFIRPCKKARERMLTSIEESLAESWRAFRSLNKTEEFPNNLSLIESLKRVAGIMQGWGKHYWFCNDTSCFKKMDDQISALIKQYLSIYREEKQKTNEAGSWRLLGIEALGQMKREPFIWPKQKVRSNTSEDFVLN